MPASQPPHQWSRFGDVLFSSTTAGEITDELWQGYVDAIAAKEVAIVFAITTDNSSAPSATQRKNAADVMQAKDLAAVVVTNNRITRGVITAVSWLGAKVRGFSWDRLDAALEHLGRSPEVTAQIRGAAGDFYQTHVKPR